MAWMLVCCCRYASTEYVLQSSCAFAELAAAPADLSLEAAGAVGEFLAGHVGSLLASSDQVSHWFATCHLAGEVPGSS